MTIATNQPQNNLTAQQREECLELFRSYLPDILSYDGELLEELNEDLADLLLRDQTFKKDLENALYANQEKIADKAIRVNNNVAEPTVANWLKDFIQKNGSNIFTNLVLTQYVANSENAKDLDEAEKKILTKLLVMYRNIKFFPNSMVGRESDDWEIIPSGKSREKAERFGNAGIKAATEQDKKLKELQDIAAQFPEGSLERRAVEEEIRKLVD